MDVVDPAGTNLNAGTLPVRVGAVTVPLTGTYNTNAGGTYRLVVGAANDPGYAPTGYTIFWGDGASTALAAPGVVTHVYAKAGPETITATATDPTNPAPNGFANAGTLAVTVNPPPTVPLTGSATANLNGTYTLTVNPANDPFQAPTNYLVHWGDGTTSSLLAPSTVSHVFTVSGADNITVDLTDGTGTFAGAGSLPITVSQGPTVAVSGNAVANAGGTYTLNFGAATDPGQVVSGYTVHWGDGATSAVAAGSATATHNYSQPGVKAVSVDLIDGTGTYGGAGQLALTVSNPSVGLAGKSVTVQGITYVLTVNPATDLGGTPSGYLVHWGDGSTTPLASAGPTSHAYSAAGNYLITTDLTDNTGTFAAAGSLALTVSKTPTLALSGSSTVNVGASYTLNLGAVNDPAGTAASYLVNWGDGTSTPVTAQTPGTGDGPVSHTYNSAGAKTISVDLTDNNGTFTAAGTLKLTVNNVTVAPTVAVGASSPVVAGTPVTLTVSPAVDPGQVVSAYVVHWGDGSTTPLSVAGSPTHTYAAAGPQTVTVDVTDGNGTYAAAGTLAVSVNPAPTLTLLTSGYANVTGNYSLRFGAATDAVGPITGYVINWGDGSAPQTFSPSAASASHVYTKVGQPLLTASVIDATGAYATPNSVTVRVSPPPTVVLVGASTASTDADYTLTFGKFTDPGYGARAYTIHWGDGSDPQIVTGMTPSVAHRFAGAGALNISVDLTDATATWPAAGSLTVNVTQPGAPTVALGGNSFANAGGTYTLSLGSVVDTNGPVTGYIISWGDGSAPQSLASSALSATHGFATAGPVNITASVVDGTGTYANAGSLPVIVSPAPTVALSGISTANAGGLYSLKLGAVTDPGYSATGYVIHWGDGSAAQSVAAGTTSVTHTFATAGADKITVDLTDATGTFAAAGALSITVNSAPKVALTGASTATAGSNYTMTIGTPLDPGYAVTGYTIHWGDGSAAQGLAAGSTSASHTFTTGGTATITIDLTDPTGTFLSAGSLPITIVSATPANVALTGNANANAGGVYTLNLGAITDPGQTPTGLVIHWGDGSAAQTVAVGTTSVKHTYASPLAAKITADITDAGGTRAAARSLNVTVNPAPKLALTGSANTTVTATYTLTLGALTDPGYTATGYVVHFGDGSAAVSVPAGTTTVTHQYASPLAAKITVDVTDATGTYLAAGSLNVTVNPTPTIALSGASSVNAGTSYTLNLGAVSDPGQTVTGYVVHWNDGATSSLPASATSASHTYTAAGTGQIKVDIIDSAGTWLSAGQLTLTVVPVVSATPKVVGRYVYYNNSSFDGNTSAATTGDFAAIATDKQALLPGQKATFANYTSYTKGINGIMLDMAGLPAGGSLVAADFSFHAGLGGNPTGWALAPVPVGIVIFRGVGSGGSDRVALTWADGAIVGKWLQIKVLATADTKLTAPDVFYFGNAPGATGTTTANPMVTGADADAVLPQESGSAVAIANAFDFNRDGLVNSLDYNIADADQTTASTALQIFTA